MSAPLRVARLRSIFRGAPAQADAICLLDYDRSGRDLERTIQVLKMRGSPHVTEKRELHLEQGGLRIEHLPRA